MKTYEETLFEIGTSLYDYLKDAEDTRRHACDSHDSYYGNGQCDIMDEVIGTVYNLIRDSINGEDIINKIHVYEKDREEYLDKANVIIRAGYELDPDLCLELGCWEDEDMIKKFIKELEEKGIDITADDNFDIICEHINKATNEDDEEDDDNDDNDSKRGLCMTNLTRENFGNVSERSFEEIKYYLDRFKNLIEDGLDYHFEKTEEDLFNWIHNDTEETPMDIKNALMPSSLINVLHVMEGWFFWYV